MGNKHRKTDLDRARDELMSHVIRCDVLEAEMEHREEWLEDTMGFMADRWPQLSELQLAQLEIIGKQFIKPAIPHGRENHAHNRPEPTVGGIEAEDVRDDEAAEALMEDGSEPEETADEKELQPA